MIQAVCNIKFFLLIFSLMSFAISSEAQQLKLGNKPTQIEQSAVLHLDSKDQGLLLTRIADTERINALDPPDGMIIYFTDASLSMPYGPNAGVYQRKNGIWQRLGWSVDHMVVDKTQSAIKFTREGDKWILHLPNATSGLRGVVSSGRQSFSGRKTFNDSVRIKNLHPGSVIFVRDDSNPNDNVLTDNNAHFFWDNTHFRLGVGTNTPEVTLDVNGNIRGNNISVPSDMRYKKEMGELRNILRILDSLRSYTYFYRTDKFKDKDFPETRQIGMIAQEVEKYFPELVSTDKRGYKSLNYARFTAVLLVAIKEQQEEITLLKKKTDSALQELAEKMKQLNRQLKGE